MKQRLIIPYLSSLCLACSLFAADDKPIMTDAVAKNIGKTYGFYIGQSLSLDAIEKTFPEIAPKVQVARLEFDSSFASAITNMDAVLAGKDTTWGQVKRDLQTKLATTFTNQILTPDSAKAFTDTVKKRAKGDIPSPIVETLLTFHPSFIAKPASEFLEGFKARYTSDGSEKAKGVKFHLDYPKSWSSAEADRPNIVRKFVSQNGSGFEMIMVMVKSLPFPPGQKPSDKELEAMVAEVSTATELKQMLPNGATFVAGGPIRIDSRPGFFQEFSLKQQRLDMTFASHAVIYTAYYKTWMIQLHCQVGRDASLEHGLQEHFDKFEPLFKLVASSLVIDSQWH